MALNARPTLSSISAFDAEFGTSGKEHIAAPILKFSWRDGVSRKNRVVIRDYDTNEKVYDCTIITMALKHQLHNPSDASDKVQVVAYNLQNGHKYIANVYVYTSDDEESLASNDVIFYCYNTPTFEFTNFDSFMGEGSTTAIVSSSSINLTVRYAQFDGEPLNSYVFELQDYNGVTLLLSDAKYSSLSEDILRYTLGGIEETDTDKYGNIQTNRAYKIICSGQTQHGIIVYTEQKFVVKLTNTGVGALVYTENIGDGTVAIYSNYKIMGVQTSTEDITYLFDKNGSPYAIDLSTGEYLEFVEGFIMQHPWEVVFKGEFKVDRLITFRTVDGYEGTITLKEINYTVFPFYYFEFKTERNGLQYSIKTQYFRKISDLVKAEVDLSYRNGLYNIQANIDFGERRYLVMTNNKGFVDVTFFTPYSITDNGIGDVELENNSLVVSDDENGNVYVL